jgi:ABC-type glycerol-3-phosphate transport system substrate-binding protein
MKIRIPTYTGRGDLPLSRRKNGVIFIAIVLLCFVLLTQLMGDTSDNSTIVHENEEDADFPIDPNINQGNEKIELTAVVFMESDEFRLLSEWNQEFQELNPGTTVQLTNLTKEQAYPYFMEQAKAGNSSNIMMLDNIYISEFAARGYLSHLANNYIRIDNEPLYGQMANQVKWNGYTWAVPRTIDPYIVVWNTALFEKEGVSKLPVTMDDWLALHNSLQLNNPEYEGIHVDSMDQQAFISLIWAFQGNWSNRIDHMYILEKNEDIQLLDPLLSIRNTGSKDGAGKPLIHLQSLSRGQSWEKFNNGQFAAMVVPLSEFIERRTGNEEVSLSLISGNTEDAGLWLSGTSYAVSSGTLHQEMAYSWIASMTNMARQVQMMELTGKLPASLSILNNSAFRRLPHTELLAKAVEWGRAWNGDPQLPSKMGILVQGIGEIAANPQAIEDWNGRLELLWEEHKQKVNP